MATILTFFVDSLLVNECWLSILVIYMKFPSIWLIFYFKQALPLQNSLHLEPSCIQNVAHSLILLLINSLILLYTMINNALQSFYISRCLSFIISQFLQVWDMRIYKADTKTSSESMSQSAFIARISLLQFCSSLTFALYDSSAF